MAEETKELDPALKKEANGIYRTICEFLDDQGIHYNKREENYHIDFFFYTSDLDIQIDIQLWPESHQIRFASRMPYCVAEKSFGELAVALNEINDKLLLGFFMLDENAHRLTYIVSQSYKGVQPGKGTYKKLLDCCYAAADQYNTKLFLYDHVMITHGQLFADNTKGA